MNHKLFFNYSIDCELPANTPYTEGREREPFFHGPRDWAFAEASVRGFVEQMAGLGVGRGGSMFVYPDVARHQKSVYRELADAGVEVALHLNGMRYSKLTGSRAKWMGAMSRAEQRDAIATAKADLEDTIGRPCRGYRACYGSASDDTFPILDELGFVWSSSSSNRYRPEFHACWRGSWAYAHHPHRQSKLVVGDLPLFEVPVTVGITVVYDSKMRQPLDLRVETPPTILGDDRIKLRQVVEENIVEMQMRDIPVRTIIGASHNTSAYNDRSTHQAQNLDWLVRHTRELAAAHKMEFTPATFEDILEQGGLVGSY